MGSCARRPDLFGEVALHCAPDPRQRLRPSKRHVGGAVGAPQRRSAPPSLCHEAARAAHLDHEGHTHPLSPDRSVALATLRGRPGGAPPFTGRQARARAHRTCGEGAQQPPWGRRAFATARARTEGGHGEQHRSITATTGNSWCACSAISHNPPNRVAPWCCRQRTSSLRARERRCVRARRTGLNGLPPRGRMERHHSPRHHSPLLLEAPNPTPVAPTDIPNSIR